jgi:hypothetical protein
MALRFSRCFGGKRGLGAGHVALTKAKTKENSKANAKAKANSKAKTKDQLGLNLQFATSFEKNHNC